MPGLTPPKVSFRLSFTTDTDLTIPRIDDGIQLLPHLFQFRDEHRVEGLELQEELSSFAQELRTVLDEVWKKSEEPEGETSLEGWAARMQEYEKQRQIDPLLKVSRPEQTKHVWNSKLPQIRHSKT